MRGRQGASDFRLWFQSRAFQVSPDRCRPTSSAPIRAGTLKRRNSAFPRDAKRVFVDRSELQGGDKVAALRKLHLIAAAEVWKDEFVLRIVTDSFHQLVVVDDER